MGTTGGGRYVGPPPTHHILGLSEEDKRRQLNQHLSNPHRLPATYYSSYQNRDMLDMLRYIAEYQEQQRQNPTGGRRVEEAGRKQDEEAAIADTPAPGTVTS